MKYLLLICMGTERVEVPEGVDLDVEPWVEELDRTGKRLIGNRVRPAEESTTVRVRNGEVLLTDGPYTETKEQMAGFDVIEAADLDEAIQIASRHPMAYTGMIEVRAFWDE